MTSRDLAVSSKSAGKGLAVGGPTAMPDPGRSSNIHAVEFAAPGLVYDKDIPKTFRQGAKKASTGTALALRDKRGAGSGLALRDKGAEKVVKPRSDRETAKIESQTIASGARQLDKPRRSGGRTVLRRVGWQATPTLIVITTVERELETVSPGKMRPVGDWLIEHRQTFRNLSGAAEKRVGTVALDDVADAAAAANHVSSTARQSVPPAAPQQGQGSAESEAAQFPEGAAAMSFLPRAVRSSLRGHVPTPIIFDGTVLQFSNPKSGEVDRQEVNVIRMDEKRAVVIQAKRKPDGKHWEVSQAIYSLGEPEIEQV